MRFFEANRAMASAPRRFCQRVIRYFRLSKGSRLAQLSSFFIGRKTHSLLFLDFCFLIQMAASVLVSLLMIFVATEAACTFTGWKFVGGSQTLAWPGMGI